MPASPRDEATVPEFLDVTQFGLTPPASGTYKDNTNLYAAGDVVAWVGQPNNANPPLGIEDPSSLGSGIYKCCGWADTSGYIFKLDETI